MSECMEKILHKAFANLLTDVSNANTTYPAIIMDFKMIFKKGKYASTTIDPMQTKIDEIQVADAKTRIISLLKITNEDVDKTTVVLKATDSSLLHSQLNSELESLREIQLFL